ncbi:hypothetical protein Tco_1038539 [Tanacetum coccineum]
MLRGRVCSLAEPRGDYLILEACWDPILRLCHIPITCSITGRSQAPEKVFEVVRFREEAGCDDIWWSVFFPSSGAFWITYLGEAPLVDAPGPERQPDVAAGAPEAAEDALVANEGAPAVPAPVQAPQPPPPAAAPTRTMAQRYTSYADFQIPYERLTRRRTDDVSTFTAQQDEHQPDP